METRKITVNEKEYLFVNESRSTRHGFAHDTTLLINGCERVKHTCHYLNRTWECYTYQTSMYGAINEVINERIDYITKRFKENNGYSKLTEKRKIELNSVLDNDIFLKEYKAVKECLHYANMNVVKNLY